MYYIDESGSIPSFRSTKWSNRYFIISFVHTNNAKHLKMIYKRYLETVRRHYPQYFATNNELKGADAPPFIKEYLLKKIIQKTDAHFGYIAVDTWNIREQFRTDPSRSFNFLIKLMMESHTLGSQDRAILVLKLDNRNTAIRSLKSLEDYLFQELVLDNNVTNNVSTEYLESCHSPCVQVADLLASTIRQYYRFKEFRFPKYTQMSGDIDIPHPDSVKFVYDMIKPKLFSSQLFPSARSASFAFLA